VLAYDSAPGLGETRASYCHILGRLVDALGPLLPGVACAGTSDLAIAGLKISGNAQQRKRTHLLHHGTFLHAFDVSRMARYLKSPPRQPEYRAQRQHAEFVGNVPLDATTLRSCLRQAWSATQLLDVVPEDMMRRLVEKKYSRAEWTHRC